jgi:hypothetical protein
MQDASKRQLIASEAAHGIRKKQGGHREPAKARIRLKATYEAAATVRNEIG